MKFKIFSVPVSLSYSSIALLTLAMIASKDNSSVVLISVLSAAAHELGHIFFIHKYGGGVSAVNIKPFEVQINTYRHCSRFAEDIIINLAGVLANFTLAFLSGIVYLSFKVDFALEVFACNCIIGLFNLLPVRGLDGCNILEIVLLRATVNNCVEKILNIISLIFMFPLATAGFYLMILSKCNYTLLFIAIYLFVLIIYKEMR